MNGKRMKQLIKIIISLLLIIISFIAKFNEGLINNLLYILAYIIVGYDIVIKAIKNIFKGKIFDENFLMTIATIGAFCIGELPEAVTVMLFYQIGELFQSYAVEKSRRSIAALMDIKPDYANICRKGKIKKVDPDEVNIGEVILVKAGEKIPIDGVIIDGEAMINTQALTGESIPRKVHINDEVLSGSINNDGVIKIKVNKKFGESTVSKILDLVENASSKKSKSENFINKFAKIYTPIVVIVAILLAILPPLIIKDTLFQDWLYRALSFLVVSCPCALVISIPLSFFGGIGAASKIGVLIKGGNYLEALAKTEIVACDKTGTLTEGIFKVQKIKPNGYSNHDLLKYATYAEGFSNHPIALSLKQSYGKSIDSSYITNTKEISGKGVFARVDGRDVLVGNEKLMMEYQIKFNKSKDIGTLLYVAVDNKFAGTILIADTIKKDSYNAIELLKKNKVENIIMITGDHKSISQDVAQRLHLDKYYAELLPTDKVNLVEKLMTMKSPNGKFIFVGDGINDAPVLALADIGIAMGGLGSDAAIEAADIVIMTDELSKISDSIQIAKKTMTITRQNIIFAIAVKISVLVLSAVGFTNMWTAVFADVGVSILAILNSLKILKVNKYNRI